MIEFTIGNFFQIISFISPFLLGFFLIVSSLFNMDIRGLIYLAGVLIATLINSLLMQLIGEERNEGAPILFCTLLNINSTQTKYKSPSPTTLFISFTAAYLLLPMIANSNVNYAVVVFLFALLGIDWVTKVKSGCTSNSGAALGTLFGCLLGFLWYTIIISSGYKTLTYFGVLDSNRLVCNKPSKQTFKCSVYKNGQLISSNIA